MSRDDARSGALRRLHRAFVRRPRRRDLSQPSVARFVPEVESATDQALAIVLDVEAGSCEGISILVIGPQPEAVGFDPVVHRATTAAETIRRVRLALSVKGRP